MHQLAASLQGNAVITTDDKSFSVILQSEIAVLQVMDWVTTADGVLL